MHSEEENVEGAWGVRTGWGEGFNSDRRVLAEEDLSQ